MSPATGLAANASAGLFRICRRTLTCSRGGKHRNKERHEGDDVEEYGGHRRSNLPGCYGSSVALDHSWHARCQLIGAVPHSRATTCGDSEENGDKESECIERQHTFRRGQVPSEFLQCLNPACACQGRFAIKVCGGRRKFVAVAACRCCDVLHGELWDLMPRWRDTRPRCGWRLRLTDGLRQLFAFAIPRWQFPVASDEKRVTASL